MPIMLVAYAPSPVVEDRARVETPLVIGRDPEAGLALTDARVSMAHCRITGRGRFLAIEDLGSTNGTFVNGERIRAATPLEDEAVIRVGETLLVFHADGSRLLEPLPPDEECYKMTGPFHLAGLMAGLREAALSSRAVLLTGPSGTGKDLAAGALARMWGLSDPLAHNAARTASEQEIARVLFGVADRAFTGVSARDGLLANAARSGRPLFLDEVHHLPASVQGVLLRVIEEGWAGRTGAEDAAAPVNVRFVLASNSPELLSRDLRARLRETAIPPLRLRVADVPAIFQALLAAEARRHDEALARMGLERQAPACAPEADHMEALCLSARRGEFDEDNVRALADLADRLVTRVVAGVEPAAAADSVFNERFPDARGEETSHYEQHRELISAVFLGAGRNVLRTVELLKGSGVPWRCSRRHLTSYLERWGLR